MVLYHSAKEYLFNLHTTSSSEAKRLWKKHIKESWDNKCAYCESEENLTLDHIIPKSKGGSDRVTNVLCACKNCNISKGHQMWSEWFLAQEFFSTEKLSRILKWQEQITENEYQVYRPRKNNTDY